MLEIAESRLDSAPSKQEANSSIFDEKSGLCSCELGNRTKGSLTKRATNLPDLSQKDTEFALIRPRLFNFSTPPIFMPLIAYIARACVV